MATVANNLYIIFTDKAGGDWKVVQGKDNEETLMMLHKNSYKYGDEVRKFHTRFLTERIKLQED